LVEEVEEEHIESRVDCLGVCEGQRNSMSDLRSKVAQEKERRDKRLTIEQPIGVSFRIPSNRFDTL